MPPIHTYTYNQVRDCFESPSFWNMSIFITTISRPKHSKSPVWTPSFHTGLVCGVDKAVGIVWRPLV